LICFLLFYCFSPVEAEDIARVAKLSLTSSLPSMPEELLPVQVEPAATPSTSQFFFGV
jgi:hypothetical protein